MFIKTLKKLFSKRVVVAPFSESTITLSVQFSFEASAQVGFKDTDNRLRIKRFKAQSWQTEFVQTWASEKPIELRTFVYTPNLKEAQQATLSISIDKQVVKQQDFLIPIDADYAGWFELSYLP
jgi:hypothetical protein